MAAKRKASRRAARKENSGEWTTVALIRIKKMYVKANTGFRPKAFPVRVRGSSESHIRTRRAQAASVPGNTIVVSNARIVAGRPFVGTDRNVFA
jgi:hypothetical protein